MVESALGNLMASILGGGLAATGTKKEAKKSETDKKVTEGEKTIAPEGESINLKELSPSQKSDLELALVMSGLSTPKLKNLMKQDSIDGSMLGGLAKILGIPTTKGKTLTTPLEDGKSPKTETMPIPEKGKGSNTTTTKGEEAKDKKTVMKGEGSTSKGTVMEIPEADLSKLIEMAKYTDFDEKNGKLMEVARQIAMKNKMHVKDVLAQAKRVYDERYQKTLESDLQKQAKKDGRVDYDKKIKSRKYQEDTDKAAEKYKAETPDYKYDDVKRKNEAKGEEYTTERHSGEPSKEAVDKADDFVWKNAGRDYAPRLDRAKNYSSIWGRGE